YALDMRRLSISIGLAWPKYSHYIGRWMRLFLRMRCILLTNTLLINVNRRGSISISLINYDLSIHYEIRQD
ncbi:hypothetical protein E2562_028913, partial [Oryza meyeriana var. granulata]